MSSEGGTPVAEDASTPSPRDAIDVFAAGPDDELAEHLAHVATVLLGPGGGATAANTIVALARSTIDNCDEAGLCNDSGLTLPGSSSALIVELERLQAETGQGPCAEALAGADGVYEPDLLLDERRWPAFSPQAAALGVRSALAYRLSNDDQTLGALQLYAHLPGAFGANDRAQGLLFAIYAGLALAQAQAEQAEDSKIENLRSALSSRDIIGQAQGILMQREKITAEQAFELLRRSSQHLNRKLRNVAQDVVDTGLTNPDVAQTDREVSEAQAIAP